MSDADGTLDTLADVAQSLAAQINAGVPMLGTLATLRLVGDFGTSVAREVGIHDSVFFAQNLDDAKWNANSNNDIFYATTVPHLTILGTGDGNPDFYAFEIKDDMISDAETAWTSPAGVLLGHTSANFPGLQVIFDIDGGFVPGDGSVWQSVLNLWELKAPLDPNQPTLPNQIASGWLAADPGSFSGLDGLLAHYIQVPGVYYLEVTAAGRDGVPEGVDYTLHVSIEQHAEDTFLFSPAPVAEDEIGNDSIPGAQDLDPGVSTDDAYAANFFTFFDPEVGNTDFSGGNVGSSTPYVRSSAPPATAAWTSTSSTSTPPRPACCRRTWGTRRWTTAPTTPASRSR